MAAVKKKYPACLNLELNNTENKQQKPIKHMSNNGKILWAVLAGAAVGAVAGILFAPAKGEDTRKRIGDQAKKLTDGVKDLVTGELAETVQAVQNTAAEFRIRGNWYE